MNSFPLSKRFRGNMRIFRIYVILLLTFLSVWTAHAEQVVTTKKTNRIPITVWTLRLWFLPPTGRGFETEPPEFPTRIRTIEPDFPLLGLFL